MLGILLKKISFLFITNSFLLQLVGKISVKYSSWLTRQRCQYEAITKHFDDFNVRYGFFRGMKFPKYKWIKYPEASQISSTIFSKLLGLYENELEPIFKKIIKQKYTEIINIGSAEGYYSIGLAIINNDAMVYSFDTNKYARKLCKRMAEINNVSDRVVIGSFCNQERLKALPLTGKSLILSDCEGCEKELFTNNITSFLRKHDLLIEIHDCIDPTISKSIKDVFSDTHKIEIISSIEDEEKARIYQRKELESYTINQRKELLAENRPSTMEWFYLVPK